MTSLDKGNRRAWFLIQNIDCKIKMLKIKWNTGSYSGTMQDNLITSPKLVYFNEMFILLIFMFYHIFISLFIVSMVINTIISLFLKSFYNECSELSLSDHSVNILTFFEFAFKECNNILKLSGMILKQLQCIITTRKYRVVNDKEVIGLPK